MPAAKQKLVASVDSRAEKLTEMSDAIWALAETAFEEEGSAKILSDYAESQGFRVERGLAGCPRPLRRNTGAGNR